MFLIVSSINPQSLSQRFWITLYIESQQSHVRFFLIHDRNLSGRVQSNLRATSDVNNHEFRQPLYHERHLSSRVQCSHRATAVSNVVTRPHPTRSIMRSGNPIYELYEFTLLCHLLGDLSIRSSLFWQQWFQISKKCGSHKGKDLGCTEGVEVFPSIIFHQIGSLKTSVIMQKDDFVRRHSWTRT